MKEKLTPTQRKILQAMKATLGLATFTGHNARRNGFRIITHGLGGSVVRCYGTPEYFLKQRGLIALVDRAVPGYWYAITDKGRAAL